MPILTYVRCYQLFFVARKLLLRKNDAGSKEIGDAPRSINNRYELKGRE